MTHSLTSLYSAHLAASSTKNRAWYIYTLIYIYINSLYFTILYVYTYVLYRYRSVLMYGFHILVTTLCTSKIQDTQCGFKLFRRDVGMLLFSHIHLHRWAFDIELVLLAER